MTHNTRDLYDASGHKLTPDEVKVIERWESETHNTREGIEEVVKQFEERMPLITSHGLLLEVRLTPTNYEAMKHWLRTTLHQELQKARVEERERIEAIFKKHVPPHAMDLEDSVWLKRLLNKAFHHESRL